MKVVRVRVTCDACMAWHESDNEAGVESVPTAGGSTLDLCPSHRSDLAPVLALMAEWGAHPERTRKTHKQPSSPVVEQEQPTSAPNRRGGAKARKRRENSAQGAPADSVNVCPACGLVSVNRGALMQHTRRMHQATLAELAEASSS